MPLFAVYAKDGTDGVTRRDENRNAHVAYIQSADADGRIEFSGPLKDETGTSIGVLIVFEADDLTAAQKWVDADPYVVAGVYASIELHAIRKVFPK